MGGGDTPEQEITAQEIAQFEVAKGMWDDSREVAPQADAMLTRMTTGYVPDGEGGLKVADNQNVLNPDGSVRIDAGQADAQAGSAWNKVQNVTADPNGGGNRFGNVGLMEDRINSQTKTGTQTRFGQQNRQIKAVENVAALGRGQEAEALQGMQDLSGDAASQAKNDAYTSFDEQGSKDYLLGQVVGAGAGFATSAYEKSKKAEAAKTAGVS